MANLEQFISFHPGPQGATSYFYVAQPAPDAKEARVSLVTLGRVKNQLHKRQAGARPVTNLMEFLLASLPPAFTDPLEQAGIDVVAAWNFMVERASTPKRERLMRNKSEAQISREQAERLARILATVAGGRKAPENLLAELLALLRAHGPEAIGILQNWAKLYGFTKRGQYVIVGNRANRSAHAKLAATSKAVS